MASSSPVESKKATYGTTNMSNDFVSESDGEASRLSISHFQMWNARFHELEA
eukprot:CAMPEP_0116020322 /NCGR_PEP_ID=MMETSP0321-20121206/9728_1 /TAXON_ID=163516 /ORGANISM="Leptocylindrus danicus var. danicus, Strain B650" /LENGTH=51 /DNA_ID=CAMNT_0003490991 /DNA_START=124 /DNA_END=276 /DNA_ORIENTATION=+